MGYPAGHPFITVYRFVFIETPTLKHIPLLISYYTDNPSGVAPCASQFAALVNRV